MRLEELVDSKTYKDFKRWMELVSRCFGGLDIFALNIVKTRGGEEHIIGIQDGSTCQFAPQYQADDAELVASVVMDRFEKSRVERRAYETYS